MGRMSFTQELKALAKASGGMDAGGCWSEVLFLHRGLDCGENALVSATQSLNRLVASTNRSYPADPAPGSGGVS